MLTFFVETFEDFSFELKFKFQASVGILTKYENFHSNAGCFSYMLICGFYAILSTVHINAMLSSISKIVRLSPTGGGMLNGVGLLKSRYRTRRDCTCVI